MSKSVGTRSLRAALIVVSTSAFTATAQSSRTLNQKLDSLAGAGLLENRAVGIVAAVVREKDTLLLKGYGKSDVEAGIPMSADALFPIGSVTKQFTAAAILQLRDQGKLSLDDELTKWLPDFDTRGNKVPLRRLLDHTSGILGLTEMREFASLSRNTTFPRDSAYVLIKRYPFQFPTGTAQIYSNSAFWLLGLIIEKASGMTYADYIEKKIFQPLGMTRSMYCSNAENVPRRAYGYGMRNGTTRRAPPIVHTWPFSAGSLCSTAGDLITWLQALHGGQVLSQKSYAEMTTPSRLTDGMPLRYSMGLYVGEDSHGLAYIGHDGDITGFSAETRWYPAAKMAIVVMTNSVPNFDPGAVAGDLAAEVLPLKRPKPLQFTGDASPLLGKYKGVSSGGDMVVEVTQTPQGIAFAVNGAPSRQLPWIERWTFRRDDALLSFRRSGNSGPATELRYDAGYGYYILARQ